MDIDEIVINYPSMFELMNDLQLYICNSFVLSIFRMAENNAVLMSNTILSRDILMAASAIYKENYGNPDGTIPATFQVIHMIGWKPDASQPVPLKRGSAKKSFKDLDSIIN